MWDDGVSVDTVQATHRTLTQRAVLLTPQLLQRDPSLGLKRASLAWPLRPSGRTVGGFPSFLCEPDKLIARALDKETKLTYLNINLC